MSGPACDTVREQAADLALDIVSGDDRAALLAHLETCPTCRSDVRSLGAAADRLLRGVPPEEPPSGFEDRVLARFAEEPRPLTRHRSRWALVGLGAAAAIIVLALVVSAMVRPGGDTREAAMVSTKGDVVGEVTLTNDPPGILVAVPGWTPAENKPYGIRLELRSGRVRDLGTVELHDGWGSYGLDDVDPGDVKRVELLTTSGKPICGADL